MQKPTNTPRLRFPQFHEEWECKELGNIGTFSKGKSISKDDIKEDGVLECIRYGELYTHYSELIKDIISKTNLDAKNLVLSEYNDIIIPSSGETQLDIAKASCVLKEGVALGGDLNIIKTKENGVFLSYYLNSKKKIDIAKLSQGVSVVHLYASQLKTLQLLLPTLPEQTQIASFLTCVDERLQLLQRKKGLLEQYKKGVMQRLFTEELPESFKTFGKLKERLRFQDEAGKDFPEWEEVDFDSVLFSVTTKKYQIKNIEIISKGTYPVIDQSQDAISGYHEDKSKLFKDVPAIVFGDHTTILKYIDFPFVVGADGTKLLVNKLSNNIKYLYYYLVFSNVKPEGYKRHFSILKDIKISLPSLPEQKKIADFLTALDAKIEAVGKTVGKLQEWKRGLLKEMFI